MPPSVNPPALPEGFAKKTTGRAAPNPTPHRPGTRPRMQPRNASSAKRRRQRKTGQPPARYTRIGIPSAATPTRHKNPEGWRTLGPVQQRGRPAAGQEPDHDHHDERRGLARPLVGAPLERTGSPASAAGAGCPRRCAHGRGPDRGRDTGAASSAFIRRTGCASGETSALRSLAPSQPRRSSGPRRAAARPPATCR
jgi:hypothetical protein